MYDWKQIKKRFIYCSLIASALCSLHAEETKEIEFGYGLALPTKKERRQLKHELPKILQMVPNKIGAMRIHEHLEAQQSPPMDIRPAEWHEAARVLLAGEEPPQLLEAPAPLPTSVNNSLLPSFPPIGNQGAIGSCVGWSSTYYVATHEIGLLNGYNNKVSNAHILSPKWTYNLINGGADSGSSPLDAYQLLAANGATSIVNFPYDSNYRAWDLKPSDWIDAISNRLTQCQTVTGFGGSQPQNLLAIKQLLANGHILSIGTFANSWVIDKVPPDPKNPSSPHVGEQAITWLNGSSGGHLITVVGYDDDLWIDVNGNGKEDEGERGAFLLANSWGTGWGNNGFIWVAYDAFLNRSAVVNGPYSAKRVGAAEALSSQGLSAIPIAPNYKPKLVAQFTLTQTLRDQINIFGGTSSLAQMIPTQYFWSGTLANSGGKYSFDGSKSTSPKSATFALDLTDLISPMAMDAQRFYLSVQDLEAKNPTTLNSFVLLDQFHQKQITDGQAPITIDASTTYSYIDYDFANAIYRDTKPPQVAITSPVNNAKVANTISVMINATDNKGIKAVELYVDSRLVGTDTTAPYLFTLDTKTLAEGPHRLSAIAYDTSNNKGERSIAISVKNIKRASKK